MAQATSAESTQNSIKVTLAAQSANTLVRIENEKGDILALDAKLGIMGVEPIKIPASLSRTFPNLKQIVVVSYDGKKLMLSKECIQVPIKELTEYLISWKNDRED